MPQLLDQFGNPVQRKVLKEEVARASLTGIRQVWTPDVAAGITPARLAGVLNSAAEGEGHEFLALAEQIEERDPHYASVLGTRKRAVSGIEPVIKAASDDARDRKIAEAVTERIAEHDEFPDLVEDMLDGLGKGFSCVEIKWASSSSEWWPDTFIHRDPRFFRFDRETLTQLLLLTDEQPVEGEELPAYKFIRFLPKLKTGIPLRRGLARLAAFTWICKAYTVKDWVAFAELFGLPLRLGKYGPEATKQDIETLYQAVASIGSDAAAVLPRSMEIEFQEVGGGTGNEVFERLANWADKQISKAVLGQTMTSDDGSSRAQAGVHNEVRMDILKADARQVSGAIQRDLIEPYVALNYGADVTPPRLHLQVEEPEDTSNLILSVQRLSRVGVRFSARDLRDRLGVKEPADEDDAVGFTTEQLLEQMSGGSDGETATNSARPPVIIDPYVETDAVEADDLEDWEEIVEGALDPVERLLAEVGSYEEALARLPEIAGEMDPATMIDRLTRAAVKARAVGEVA